MPVSVWVLLVLLAMSAAGWWLSAWWERRRPSSFSRRPEVLEAWRSMPARAQAAHDAAVLDAQEAAAARALGPSVVVTAELIVEAEYARSITER